MVVVVGMGGAPGGGVVTGVPVDLVHDRRAQAQEGGLRDALVIVHVEGSQDLTG